MGDQLLYNINFDIAGLIIIMSVLIIHLSTYRLNSPNNVAFRRFLYVSLLNGVTSIITSYTISYITLVDDTVNMALNVIYQIAACLTAYCGLRYVMVCLNIDRTIDRYIDAIGALLYLAVLFLNLHFDIMFSFQNHVYVKGPLYQISYFIQAYYVIHGGVVMIAHRKSFPPRQLFLNMSYVVIPIISGIVQVVLSDVMLTFFGGAVAALFMIFSLETSDYMSLQKAMAELDVARAEAMEANRAKSDFLARMSHEIRTPINGILGMNSMIAKSDPDDNIKEYSAAIDSAGKNLLAIVNGILDLSKVESGKVELVENDYKISALVDECYDVVAPQAESKGLSLDVEMDPNLPYYVYGDETLIRQVVINLLNNAVKYTEKGGVRLSISGTHPEGAPDDAIELSFRIMDTGIGIKPEQQDQLFKEYMRVGDAKTRSIEGTGLGLSIVANFVRILGGTISVESEYGSGSVFTVVILQRIVEETAVGLVELESLHQSDEVLYAPDARILIVDDVELNLKVAAGYLAETGAQIDMATSGRECLEAVKRNRYDIIFTDHMMPDMDGVETFKQMKGPEYILNATTPVVMMTANAIHGAREEYLNEGFADYLSKPLTQDELTACIARHLDASLYQWMTLDAYKAQAANVKPCEEETLGEDSSSGYWMSKLDFLNVAAALPYCGDNLDFYLELVSDFVTENRMASLKECYDAQDWTNYEVQIHALKSSSKLIGAIKLAELAFVQELAAKNLDLDSLHAGHAICMREYDDLLAKLSQALKSDT